MPAANRVPWIWLGATLLAASVGVGSCLILLLETMMRATGDLFAWVTIALFIIVVVFAGTVVLAFTAQPTSYHWLFPTAMVIMLVAGSVPRALWANARHQEQVARQAENRAFEAKIVADIETRRKDVDARIAAQRPYTGSEALAFFGQVTGSDLTYRGLGDHSQEALPLLKRALEAKILDPNVMVRGPAVVDTFDEPLFVHISRARIRGRAQREEPPPMIRRLEWDAFKLLAENGADLTRPDAARAAADLRRTAVAIDNNPSYLSLQ